MQIIIIIIIIIIIKNHKLYQYVNEFLCFFWRDAVKIKNGCGLLCWGARIYIREEDEDMRI